ncbi:MAG: hypothetical protein ACYC3I_20000 [Gemmataceae bacterium]
MKAKGFVAGLLAVVGMLAWSGASRGGDTIRLNGVDNAPTKNLVDDGQGADTIRTWYRGYGWGGYRGFGYGGWGGYRGFGYGGWGYRGLGWGGLGYGGWGWGGYRGLGWGGFYRPYYGFGLGGYGLGLGGFYPGFGLGYSNFFWPCAGVAANVYTLNGTPAMDGAAMPGAPQAGNVVPAPQPGNDGTFPYDGGPAKPAPTPKDTPPSSTTPRSVPLEGLSVSLPKASPKWSYPAYGETARRTTGASERTYLTRGEDKNSR